MTAIRTATETQAISLTLAIDHLRQARNLLRVAECPQSLDKTRAALKSAEGAERHMRHRLRRAGIDNATVSLPPDAAETIEAIRALLDGVEWEVETLEEIAAVLRDAGYTVREPEGEGETVRARMEAAGYEKCATGGRAAGSRAIPRLRRGSLGATTRTAISSTSKTP